MKAQDGSGLRKRQVGFAAVPNDTVWDEDLPTRALGVLTKLIALPEDWDLDTGWLVEKCGGDGREAVMTALRHLRRLGYYRVERRRLASGRFVTGVSVSDVRVPEWAAQHAQACTEQGTEKPKWDTTLRLLEDGRVEDEPAKGPAGNVQVRPETGFPDPGEPDPVNPVTGEPATGRPDVTTQTETQTHTQRGSVEEVRHQRDVPAEQPSPSMPDGVNRTCLEHRLTPALGPCTPCGRWRRAAEAADAERDAEARAERAQVAADERDRNREARNLVQAERDGCRLCDADGTATVADGTSVRCLHDAGANERAHAIRQEAKAALAAPRGKAVEAGRQRALADRRQTA